MIGYVLFLLFWLVFGVFYFTRNTALDNEKIRNCDLY